MLNAKQASLVQLILTHLRTNPELGAAVGAATQIPNFPFVVRELEEAIGEHMVGPV